MQMTTPLCHRSETLRSLSIPLREVWYRIKSVLTTMKWWKHSAEVTETQISAFTCCCALIRLWGLVWNFRRDLLLTRVCDASFRIHRFRLLKIHGIHSTERQPLVLHT